MMKRMLVVREGGRRRVKAMQAHQDFLFRELLAIRERKMMDVCLSVS
jgi:hypothetical protein